MNDRPLMVPLRDGRQLTGFSFGPADGRPVLFVAGAGTGKSMRFGTRELAALGVRLITMDRPGMGSSTEHTTRDVQTTAEDYRLFLSSVLGEDTTRIPVVANSQGSVFGLAAAVAGWASPLVLVSPADEVAHPPVKEMLAPHAAALADLVTADPVAATELLSEFNQDGMEQMVVGSASDVDRRFYTSPAFLDMYRRSLQEGFANAGVGYVRDTFLAMSRWDLPLTDIQCQVRVLVGADDTAHSPDRGENLTSRIPTAKRELIAGTGGALLWTHGELVLRHALTETDFGR